MSIQNPLLSTQLPLIQGQFTTSFWNKYKNYILGSVAVIIVGVVGYFIYKRFKKNTRDKIDCQLSDWIYDPTCVCDSGSLSGHKYHYQTIIKQSDNGGIECPSSEQLKRMGVSCNCSSGPTPTSNGHGPTPSKTNVSSIKYFK